MFLINILQQNEWGEWDSRRDKVMLPTKKLRPGNGGHIERSRSMMGEKKGHFMLQNYSSLSEIVSVMSLQHLAEATEIL